MTQNNQQKRALVTGGAGFIGSHIVDALLERGWEVVVIDNLSTGSKENLPDNVPLFEKDLQDDLSDVFEGGIDVVYHTAAQANVRKSIEDPKFDAEVNILGSLNLLNFCVEQKVKKIIFSSTGGAIYSPEAEIPCVEESLTEPLSPYGLAKRVFEQYLEIYGTLHGLSWTALRYANVYGPRQNAKGEAGVISIFIDNALSGKPSYIFGDGDQTRDFVYVKDVVNANLHAFDNDLKGIFNVGTSVETSINHLFESLVKLLHGDIADPIHKDAIEGEHRRNALAADKLEGTGWKRGYSLDEGLEATVKYVKEASDK